MIRKQIRTKVICLFLCSLISLSGCGNQVEDVTKYGEQNMQTSVSSEQQESEASTEEIHSNISEGIEIKDARTGQKLSDWLGGKELTWEHTFTVDKYPADSNLVFHIAETREEMDTLMETGAGGASTWDTDELPAWQAKGISTDEIKEAEIVQNLLGDSAKEIRGTVGLGTGDAENVIGACRDFVGRYENPDPNDDSFYREYDNPDFQWKAWSDGEDYFWHTYEGKYLGMDYQLMIGYLGEYHQKVISFFPKNPGDLVGAPELSMAMEKESDEVQVDTGDNQMELKSLTDLGAKEKEVSKNQEALRKEAESFVKDKLYVNVHDIQVDDTRLLFYNESLYEHPEDFSGTVIGGRCAEINWRFGKQGVYTDENTIANTGQIWLTDEGVVGIRAYIGWDFEKCLSEQIEILPYETAMGMVESEISEQLDLSKVTGSTLSLTYPRFMYYPVSSPENPMVCTFIPVWVVGIISGPNYYMGEALINAIDGKLVDIKYSK